MKVGDSIKVYRKTEVVTEQCSHGGTHNVPIYEVKRITVTAIEREWVDFLNYDSGGMGDVLYAEDAQGRVYRKRPNWAGPRATLWVRDYGSVGFDQYPRPIFSRDLTGRALSL